MREWEKNGFVNTRTTEGAVTPDVPVGDASKPLL